jgi:hypothetical protein
MLQHIPKNQYVVAVSWNGKLAEVSKVDLSVLVFQTEPGNVWFEDLDSVDVLSSVPPLRQQIGPDPGTSTYVKYAVGWLDMGKKEVTVFVSAPRQRVVLK